MDYKKRQWIGFGLIIVFLLILLSTMISNLNSLRKNMTEIVDDRYEKVKVVLDMRQLFSQSDREILYAALNEGKNKAEKSVEILEKNQTAIMKDISQLSSVVNTADGKRLSQQLNDQYQSYTATETKIIQAVTNKDNNANLESLMNDQMAKRSEVTKTLNDFKTYQEKLMDTKVDESQKSYESTLFLSIIGSVIGIIFVSAILLWMLRKLSQDLSSIAGVIKDIDYHNLSSIPRININTKDEIGDIAHSFNAMAESLEQYNLNEKKYTQEMNDQNWIQTGLAEIGTMYQRIEDIQVLANRLLTKLAPMINASFGVFYLRKGDGKDTRFIKLADIAGDGENIGREAFRVGEGIIGQCVSEQKSQVITHIPDNYQLVTTGLGQVSPKSILIAPVIFEEQVVAVIEMASLETFTPVQEKFIQKVLETLGITINSVEGRMEIERLLKESQAQTEELQAQSEELQAQSEELQTQAEELRMINEQLSERTYEAEEKSHQLEETKKELEEQALELQRSSQYKSEFMANMSHELRTPLNSIIILSEMLQDPKDSSTAEEKREFAQIIGSSGQDLLTLINDILDLSKVEVGKLVVEFEEMNVSEIPDLLYQNFKHIAKNKGISFEVKMEDNIPALFYTDHQRFQQIMKNLLSNAFKFTDDGSVDVHFKKADMERVYKHVQGANPTIDWIEINISDTGIGIPKDKQELIFEAFQQADGATIRRYGGTGLGLSISREFAKLLGGNIICESVEGQGSTFTLFLPNLPEGVNVMEESDVTDLIAATVEAERCQEQDKTLDTLVSFSEEQQKEQANSNKLTDKKILIVDDDNRNIFALRKVLEAEGMNIITAQNGYECLDILHEENTIDAVLMDIMMPGMDGYETMQLIRQQEQYQELPIIALTAKAMKGDRAKCLKAGASDYVSKPLKVDQLLSVLRVWLTSTVVTR
ncbi:response regulator [Rummeliibacillus stabekisii]|uniref:response regulator n=1 Tax=Rummeliibacillus stabekisii TaxID=241244 RepID=UPI00116BC509|nr:response regulator [Rummeliibacillus stabekisii]MBB5168911.1 two-component system chemotaxis sensor kinase CheA [Rummeliibacillus stabekisii]GEL04944.1 histidine kinase [Rummeliibacillus stabekisii]